jgi:hypothetical protein
MQSLRVEFERLKVQVTDAESWKAKVEVLTNEVEILKANAVNTELEVQHLKTSMSSQPASDFAPVSPAMASAIESVIFP